MTRVQLVRDRQLLVQDVMVLEKSWGSPYRMPEHVRFSHDAAKRAIAEIDRALDHLVPGAAGYRCAEHREADGE